MINRLKITFTQSVYSPKSCLKSRAQNVNFLIFWYILTYTLLSFLQCVAYHALQPCCNVRYAGGTSKELLKRILIICSLEQLSFWCLTKDFYNSTGRHDERLPVALPVSSPQLGPSIVTGSVVYYQWLTDYNICEKLGSNPTQS